MPLRVYRGLPGTGKSSRLIAEVTAARAAGRPVATFASRESPRLRAREHLRETRLLGCRQPGAVCPLDHFVTTDEAAGILAGLPPETLVAIEEAYEFAPRAAADWAAAARRGLEVVVVSPSQSHRAALVPEPLEEVLFTMPCDRCHDREAETFVIVPGQDATRSLCRACMETERAEITHDVLQRLERQPPYPGEKAIYQPVELDECSSWRVLRPDSARRLELVTRILGELGLVGPGGEEPLTYLDVGCNTGYFCHHLRRLGFHATGVDVVEGDIEVARLLDSYVRRDQNTFICEDAHRYLATTQDESFDVTSAFAVFQWVMIQTSVDHGVECLERLFAKTRRVCFVEMGYGTEEQYKGRLPDSLDPDWVFRTMRTKGDFAEVRMLEAGRNQLMFGSRDLFVGIKA